LVVVVGLLSAVHATMVGRASADAKTSLAYASMAQVGLIFAEIGMGFTHLALIHILGHALTRTLQFLRAPSMLHDYHGVHAAAGGHLEPTGAHYEAIFPARARLWLYRLALDRGHHDAVLERLVVGPLWKLSAGLAGIERRLLGALTEPAAEEHAVAAPRRTSEVTGGMDV
jgi:NAD(P)H-quinone oxidoreductase subunit 5